MGVLSIYVAPPKKRGREYHTVMKPRKDDSEMETSNHHPHPSRHLPPPSPHHNLRHCGFNLPPFLLRLQQHCAALPLSTLSLSVSQALSSQLTRRRWWSCMGIVTHREESLCPRPEGTGALDSSTPLPSKQRAGQPFTAARWLS